MVSTSSEHRVPTVAGSMSSISRACNLPGLACTLRDEHFFRDRRVLRAKASRRGVRFTLLEARRRIAVSCDDEPQATGTAEDQQDSHDDATPFTRRRREQQKRLLKAVAPKQKAPFRPPSREPSPLPALPHYDASLRQRHLRYYDSIRHTFSSNASSVATCAGRHANCKAAHAASKDSERPPWNDSTQLSFAPAGFQFQCQLPGSKRAAMKAAGKSEKGKAAEVKPSTTRTPAQQKQTSLQLPDFSFLFHPVRFSPQIPAKKVNKMEEKTSAKKGALASVDNTGSASQDIKLGGSMRRHLASKENMPGVGPHPSIKSNATSKEKQANFSSVPEDKENVVKSSYNLRRAKLSSANK